MLELSFTDSSVASFIRLVHIYLPACCRTYPFQNHKRIAQFWPRSSQLKAQILKRWIKCLLTAGPMLNKPKDLLGRLAVVWREAFKSEQGERDLGVYQDAMLEIKNGELTVGNIAMYLLIAA